MKSIVDIGETCDLIGKVVVLIDSSGIVKYVNDTFEIYFPTPIDLVVGGHYSEVLGVMDKSGLLKLKLFSEPNVAIESGEGILLAEGKVEYYLNFNARKYCLEESKEECWMFIFADMSEKVELTQQLKHKRRLEVLGDLAVGVAHDINNTLGSIVGCTEILSHELGGNERLGKLSNSIIKSANGAANLSQKLLRFSTPSEATFELVNIHELLDELIEILSRSIDKKITIKNDFVDQEVIICADRAELEMVFFNLVLNAQEAMAQGGELVFKTEVVDNINNDLNINDFEMCAQCYLRISLLYSGGGLEEKLFDGICSPELTTINLSDGKSMGLSAVYDIMKHHEGAIDIKSELGTRSELALYLPLAMTKREKPDQMRDTDLIDGLMADINEEKKLVLLVDDNDLVRLSMHEVLLALDCDVIEAKNGEEGVKLFKEHLGIIDFVLLDVIMPIMDGREALIDMRAVNTSIPIFIASGFMNQLSLSVFMELGANGYLAKPFRVDELRKIINRLGIEGDDISESQHVEYEDAVVVGKTDDRRADKNATNVGREGAIELMLVEGNENVREIMQEILYENGFNVTAFKDIEHAKTAVISGKYFSLCVIDIDFKNEHDNELFALLKNNIDNFPRYIIASSGRDIEGVAARALKLGADDFLVKPFSLNFMKIRIEVAKRYIENEQLKIKMQVMLRENQERMSLAIDGAGIGMWDWKINEKEFYASEKCKELFGYVEGSKEGVLDYLNGITLKEDLGIMTVSFAEYLREPIGILNVEFRIAHPTKGSIWISSISKMFDDRENGKSKRLIGIAMDITERKVEEKVLREESQRLEEMVVQRTGELLKSNEKLSKEIEAREIAEMKNVEHQLKLMDADKLASIGILVAGIGHEINNPIQFIMFNLPFVKNAWESVLPILDDYHKTHPDFELRGIPYALARGRLPNMADDIMEGAERISSIVKELREYSRQSKEEAYKDEDMVEVVLSAKALFSKFMGKTSNDIGLHTPGEHIMATINRTRVEQVIMNLLQNASLALEGCEKKEISIDLKYSGDKQLVEIEVSDTGAGIKEEDIKHLTDPFFTTRSGDGGTGLGLAMCNRIVHNHAGEMSFSSELGVGTTVRVVLPVKREIE